MKYLVVFLFLVGVMLWIERFYWKKRADLLESKLMKKDPAEVVNSWFDAWLDGRIEARLRKRRQEEEQTR